MQLSNTLKLLLVFSIALLLSCSRNQSSAIIQAHSLDKRSNVQGEGNSLLVAINHDDCGNCHAITAMYFDQMLQDLKVPKENVVFVYPEIRNAERKTFINSYPVKLEEYTHFASDEVIESAMDEASVEMFTSFFILYDNNLNPILSKEYKYTDYQRDIKYFAQTPINH